ncbi:MAG: prohibitin family protein [Candidatus Coproplasma sp.]
MTIGIILGIIFAVITAACIAVAICLITGRRPFGARGNKIAEKKPLAGGLTVAGAAVAFILFLLIPFSFHTVQAGEVAVVKHLGEARNVRTAGTYFDFWITESYEKYDSKVQNLDIKTTAYSSDAQTMDVNMTLQYQINSQKAIEIANNYGTLDTLSNRIQSVTIEKCKSVLSKYSAMKIIETRSSISPEVETSVQAAIGDNYYVSVHTVVLTNIDFSDAFEKTVEDKMIAEQEKLKAEYEKETAIINAEKELEVSKRQAEAKLVAANADAQAQVLVAQAEADALKAKSIEVARMLGFTITENTVTEDVTTTDENGETTVTQVDKIVYSIDFTGKSAEEIKLISEYLKYTEYLSKWDGKLPEVMTGENGATIMIPVTPSTGAGTGTGSTT